ncbi:MAG: response regulator [Acidobacteriota bacterium]
MRILLIDDEPGVTDNLELYMRDDAHTIEVLNSIASRQELVRLLKEFQPEGVTLDFEMDPSGEAVYDWIRAWSRAVPIVFYTKYAGSPIHKNRMLEIGAAADQIVAKGEAARDVTLLLQALRGAEDSAA